MRYYFAPMEGVTGYIYRNAHHDFFPGIDKYFAPFISPSNNGAFHPKELRDVMPENNPDLVLIPQILANRADYFIQAANDLKKLGYEEINLNLGCPSGTVVAKKKGAGFLENTEALDAFLDEIFQKTTQKISIKTRIGKNSPEEFEKLLQIYNQYPLEELIIHPRIQKDFYKNQPNLSVFSQALKTSRNPVCYNGDLFTKGDYDRFCGRYADVDCVMMGRGLIGNPGLVCQIKGEKGAAKEHLQAFHQRLYQDYKAILSPEKIVLCKMKEVWSYMADSFTNSEKIRKKIRKVQTPGDYQVLVSRIFREESLLWERDEGKQEIDTKI